LTFLRLPSFDGESVDSHSFEVDALLLLSANVVTGDGKDEVDADAMGSDVSSGAGCANRDARKTLLTARCDVGLGGGVLLSLNSRLSEKTSPSRDALFPS
jgi:hypothetical protein